MHPIAITHSIGAAADAVTDPEERLYNYLFNGTYNKSIRPGFIENGTKLPLIIHATFYPFRVVALVRGLARHRNLLINRQLCF